MIYIVRLFVCALFALLPACSSVAAPPPAPGGDAPPFGKIKHIVFIIQENHTFDSIFGGPNPFPGAETASSGKNSSGTTVPLLPQYMGDSGGARGLANYHVDWSNACDLDTSVPLQLGLPRPCRMDGFDKVRGGAPSDDAYTYARYDQTAPYWEIARKYALADHFFASHNSESYTAHQYLFAGQSGFPGTLDDPQPRLAVPPTNPGLISWNCAFATQLNEKTFQWDPNVATLTATEPAAASGPGPCWSYTSLADLLNAKNTSWRVYVPFALFDVNSLASIQSIYQSPKYWPANCTGLTCVNNDYFRANLAQFLTDYTGVGADAKYKTLAGVTWFLAPLFDSDHPLGVAQPRSMGPNWVASLVDAIGNGPDWSTTAIFVTWDDWGGYYDHVPPYVVRDAAGVGFRVPLMIVSPYTKPSCILKANTEFGTLLKFTEDTFHLGKLGANAVDQSPFINSLDQCFDWSSAQPFRSVAGALPTAYWVQHFGRTQPTSKDQIRDQ